MVRGAQGRDTAGPLGPQGGAKMDHHRESHGDARREVHRGEVFYADLSPVVGSEQGGVRPVLIVQNDVGNRYSPTVIAAAITSKQDKTRLPTHIGLRAGSGGLARDSVVLLEQIRTLDKRRLRERIGSLPPEIMEKVSEALRISLAVDRNEGAQRSAAPI